MSKWVVNIDAIASVTVEAEDINKAEEKARKKLDFPISKDDILIIENTVSGETNINKLEDIEEFEKVVGHKKLEEV